MNKKAISARHQTSTIGKNISTPIKKRGLLVGTVLLLNLLACGEESLRKQSVNVEQDIFSNLKNTARLELASSKAPAVSIAIMKDGELVFAEAFGSKKHKGLQAVDENTLFQLGSTTKMLTALAILKLVEENQIFLNQSLTNAIPSISLTNQQDGWQDITIHHLLTHQSGFRDFVDWEPSVDLMGYALNQYPSELGQMNPAGKFFNYSNPNFSYLGAVIEQYENMDYQDAMKEMVFLPLQMSRTTMSYNDVANDGNFALGVGFTVIDKQIQELKSEQLDQVSEPKFSKPAGGYTWSTPSEMVRMGDFLLNGDSKILSNQLRQQMVSPQVSLELGYSIDYGYGIFLNDGFLNGQSWYPMNNWEHDGNTLLYTSIFRIFPEQNLIISILSSGESTDFNNTFLAAVKSVTSLADATYFPTIPIARDLFDNHVGRYFFDSDMIEISKISGQLIASIPSYDLNGTTYVPILKPIGGSHFTINVNGKDLDITFLPEQVGGLSTYIRSRSFVAIRAPD